MPGFFFYYHASYQWYIMMYNYQVVYKYILVVTIEHLYIYIYMIVTITKELPGS